MNAQPDTITQIASREFPLNDRLKAIVTLPSDPIYQTPEGNQFYRPNVTMMDLSNFFQDFMKKNGCEGVSITMDTHKIYSTSYKPQLFSALYFRKNRSLFPPSLALLKKLFTGVTDKSSREQLQDLMTPSIIREWGYAGYKIGRVISL